MQSSTLVVFRTFVMLACLVAAPAVAILGGSSWQEIVRTCESLKSPPPEQQTISAPPPRSAIPVVQIPAAPPQILQPIVAKPLEAVSHQVHEPVAAASPEPPVLPPAPPFWPAQGASLADRLAGASQSTIAANSPANLATDSNDNRVVPASYESPSGEGGKAKGFPASPTPGQRNEFIQQQLKSLGAQHFRLLSWGPEGRQFKFECKMSLDTNPRYIRFFQAVGETQQAAMQGVLDQVEAWRRSMNRD